MVLVDAEAVEAQLVGVFELVEVTVVERVPFDRIVVAVGQRHPRRIVTLGIGQIEVGVRHQVERDELHGRTPWANAATPAANACGCSTCGRWPASGMTSVCAPAIAAANVSAWRTGKILSSAPHTISAGKL